MTRILVLVLIEILNTTSVSILLVEIRMLNIDISAPVFIQMLINRMKLPLGVSMRIFRLLQVLVSVPVLLYILTVLRIVVSAPILQIKVRVVTRMLLCICGGVCTSISINICMSTNMTGVIWVKPFDSW